MAQECERQKGEKEKKGKNNNNILVKSMKA
jgi:hypothetical protein